MHAFAAMLAACALLFGAAPLHAQEPQSIPKLSARVTDLTSTLSDEQRASLEAKLADFEHRKGAQIAALIVPSVKPESIDEYAVRVMEAWKLGRKDVNDGVLLVVAKEDRKLRIEVGYGLEGVLSDAVSKRIVSDVIAPRFKENDFFAGIDAGADAIIGLVSGEALPEPAQNDEDAQSMMLFVFVPMFLVLSLAGAFLLRERFGRMPSASINAAATGTISGIFLLAAGIAWVALPVAAAAFAMTWWVAGPRSRRQRSSWLPGGAVEPDDDWSSRRSRSSGSDSSSSSSDSDFSGGGGSSGGGGASGDW